MQKKPLSISRRNFLKGAGTVLALPFFESLVPRSLWGASLTAPQRLALFHSPAGIVNSYFYPTAFGSTFTMSPTLAALASLQSDILILNNMANGAANASPQKGGEGRHSLGMATLFTGASLPLDAKGPVAATSVDQLYAQTLVGKTPVNSLQLARVIDGGDCDPDYDCADIKTLSWSNATTPLTPLTQAQTVFNNFFASADPTASAAAQAQRRALDKSILDSVQSQAKALQSRLATGDAAKLDQYLTSVRALETQIAAVPSAACSAGTAPGTIAASDIIKTSEAMMDLMILAFQCDLTRVISFSFGNGHNNTFFSFLPNMPDGQHGTSHNDTPSIRMPASAAMEAWQVSMIGRFLQGLKNSQDAGGGTVLSNTVAVYSSELANGNAHDYDQLPVLVAGQGGGFIKTGRHLKVTGTANGNQGDLSQLYLAILQGFGMPVKTFGGFHTGTPLVLG